MTTQTPKIQRQTMPTSFSCRLRTLRHKLGISTEELAARTGCCSASYLNRMENGSRSSPSALILQSLAEVFGVPISVLGGFAEIQQDMEYLPDASEIIIGTNYLIGDYMPSSRQKEVIAGLLQVLYDHGRRRISDGEFYHSFVPAYDKLMSFIREDAIA
jgi:transcriptional regulator with XRE-family HTH domain